MARIEGIDLARTIAFVGMVLVNFKVVLQVVEGEQWPHLVAGLLEGKAAASFVVLAGLGLALSLNKLSHWQIVKRSLFLLALGLLNNMVFPADIIHYYAFYFLIGGFLIGCSIPVLVCMVVIINLAFVGMLLLLDYDSGWDWATLTYHGFWTAEGFIRNLFFNGFHPILPWLGFLLVGGILAQLRLDQTPIQNRLLVVGLLMVLAAQLVTTGLLQWLAPWGPELSQVDLAQVVTTAPMPPTPLYTVTGIGAALFLLGACLRLGPWLSRIGVLRFITPLGRQTLTWYIGHIFIGMGVMEAQGLLQAPQSIATAWYWSLGFCVFAVLCAYSWSRFFKQGPIESLMRRLTN